MNIHDHLEYELKSSALYELSDNDKLAIKNEGVESFIYSKLTSKKFRKWKIDESSQQQVKHAIHLNVVANKPIQFRFPFGGYKLWRLPSSPEVDWAEFFTISYYVRYLAPIAAAYSLGIEFYFASDDVIIERMDNIPAADTDAYFDSFKRLLEYFAKYFPANFKVDVIRISDLYPDKTEMEEELSRNIEKFKGEFANSDPERKQKMLTTSELNIRWDGLRDLSNLDAAQKKAVIEMGPVYHDAYCTLTKRQAYNRGEDKILIFTTQLTNSIAIGTTKSSVTKFWTGYGVLKQTGDAVRDIILSPQQLAEHNKLNYREKKVALLQLKNFPTIRVYDL